MDSSELPAVKPAPASARVRTGSWHFPLFVALGGSLIAACGGGGPTSQVDPGVPVALKVTTIPTTSASRVTLGNVIVQVVDGNGDPVDTAGVPVLAALANGTTGSLGGTLTRTTAAGGQATFNNLTFSGLVGSKTLKFTAGGLAQATGTFTLTAGPAAGVGAASSQAVSAVISQAVVAKPSVLVSDLDGNGVSGVAVTFAITGGGGTASGLNQTTNASGVATVGSWTMGPVAGPNTMTATSAGLTGSPVSFTATAGTTASNFNIDLRFLGSGTAGQQAAFAAAKARWEQVIIGDIAAFNSINLVNDTLCTSDGQHPNPTPLNLSGTVDDVVIFADLKPIDGAGNILGAASPCYIRQTGTAAGLTIVGYMQFDVADLATLEANGDLDDVAIHEMGHVLGFGTLWATFNKISGSCGATPIFIGTNAVAAYTGSNGGSGTSVPVEDFGTCVGGQGNGTRDSHWEETIFQSELMTGFISGTVRPLSLTSIKSIQDLGYVVSASAADPFNITTQPTIRLPDERPPLRLTNDILPHRIRYLDAATGKAMLVPGQ